jgi:hypothetical protein
MSPITFTQQGIITQYELAKILIITSHGVLEVALPLTDDDRRDMEIHLRGKFARNIAFQVKSTLHLEHRFKAYQLSMFFSVPKDKLVSHPNFWYFFGYFDMKAMAFANPVFIVPSAECRQPKSIRTHRRAWTVIAGPSTSPQASMMPHATTGSLSASRPMRLAPASSRSSGMSRCAVTPLPCLLHWPASTDSSWWASGRDQTRPRCLFGDSGEPVGYLN